MSVDFLAWLKENLELILRARDLNMKLLDTLSALIYWILQQNLVPPDKLPSLRAILHEIHSTLEELEQISSPPNWQHRFRTPKDSTEP